jgi:hypothetical protein
VQEVLARPYLNTSLTDSVSVIASLTAVSSAVTRAPPIVVLVRAPESWYFGSALPLQLQVSVLSEITVDEEAALRYTWSMVPLIEGNVSTSLPGNSSLLTVDQSQLFPDVTYEFSVIVTDTLACHASAAGVAPWTKASVSVAMQTARPLSAIVAANACGGTTLCDNGGTCIATPVSTDTEGSITRSSSITYTLSCLCPVVPVPFYGITCSFAVLSCPSCVSSYTGGNNLTLFGLQLDSLFGVSVAGLAVPFSHAEPADTSSPDVRQLFEQIGQSYADQLQQITFITAAVMGSHIREALHAPITSEHTTRGLISSVSLPSSDILVLWPPHRSLSSSDAATASPADYQLLTLDSDLALPTGGLLQVNLSSLLFYATCACSARGLFQDENGN